MRTDEISRILIASLPDKCRTVFEQYYSDIPQSIHLDWGIFFYVP